MKDEQYEPIIVSGVPFTIDYTNKALFQDDAPEHTWKFADLYKEGGFHQKEIQLNSVYSYLLNEYDKFWVMIPDALLDPSKREIFNNPEKFNEESYQQDWHVLMYTQQFKDRLAGKLPEVTIAGEAYTFNGETMEFVHQKDLSRLDGNKMELDNDTGKLSGYYNTFTKRLVLPDDKITQIPEGTVGFAFPNIKWIDPVGLSLASQVQPTVLLDYYIMSDHTTAKVSGIKETDLPRIAEQNRRREHEASISVPLTSRRIR